MKLLQDISHDETPSRARDASIRRSRSRFRTPLPFGSKTHSKTLSEPQSAMKGVVLTETGEYINTPTLNLLLTLLDNSPVRGFKGFGRLEEAIDNEDSHGSDTEALSSPEDERGGLDFGQAPSPAVESPSLPVSRLRKPSLARLRPLFPSLATAPAGVPTVDKSAPSPVEPDPSQSAPASVGSAGGSNTAQTDYDEENLPSPFLKRVERAARAGFKPASRRTSTEASKALRSAAAANAAGKGNASRPTQPSNSANRVSAG